MLLSKLVWAYAVFVSSAVAVSINCFEAAQISVTAFTYNASQEYYVQYCSNEFAVTSLWAACKTYCTLEEINAGAPTFAEYCVEYGVELPPYATVLPRLTDAFISSLPVVNYEDIEAHPIQNTSAIFISKALFHSSYKTFSVFTGARLVDTRYGWGVYGFWGNILLIGMIVRFCRFLADRNRSRMHQHDTSIVVESQSPTEQTRPYTAMQKAYGWIQAKILIAPTIGTYHRRQIWGFAVPTRLETFVIAAYWAWSLIICFVGYDVFNPNLYYKETHIQAWRYISDRTGIISYANLPIIWMFSGRNNIFLWATGWELATFNLFHRHVACVATLQAVIHSIAWTVLEDDVHALASDWKLQYWYMGGVAMITMCLVIGTSMFVLRQKSYEIFLVLHIILSIITIVGLFFHTKVFSRKYDGYLWPLVAIWCFDRFVRIVRQVYCNIHVRFGGLSTTKSTVEYIAAANLIVVNVTLGSSLNPKANEHYYLYQPFRWRGWESHPFTVASFTSGHSAVDSIPTSPTTEKEGRVAVVQKTVGPTLTFYIRPSSPGSSSFTSTLQKLCSGKHEPVPLSLLLEGPYGNHAPLNGYDSILFITGGTGIAAALPYLKDFLSNPRHPRIKFVWATRQMEMVREIYRRELSSLLASSNIDINTFVTVDSSELDKDVGLSVKYGRPDVRSIVQSMAEEKGKGSMAVFVCGPAGMADEARDGVGKSLNDGVRRIELFEEVFGW